ncbi:MAG TPA: tRNA (N(6)-L-threonylcarbamoyladenosine(37)-C(2))-methylthiotransferase MtaB [Acholeplasmataceae bacterium]|nr:tRNA (N(6)-L-threonylcarbamoyladenosine(37)-C(2))-methylthiotransferase MtaB [Acholeplasmataceae bacterium]
MKVSYYSLGCKVNMYEAEAVINKFLDNGFELAEFNDVCDVYIINTCTVTANSDQKSRQIIRKAIKNNPKGIVAVMGCFAELNHEDVEKIEGVDILIGTSKRNLLFSYVMEFINKKEKIIKIDTDKNNIKYEELKVNRFENKTRGFVKIQDGCDNFCSYCRIPYARGRSRSRKPEDVINEINILFSTGIKEIVLTGINTGNYGKDLDNYSFAKLLNDLVKIIPSLGRIRISSIEVTELTDELLIILEKNKNYFCNHFHIPIQSGANNVLKNMNRKYNTDYFFEKINKIRKIYPGCNITTDVMVGFNGETEEAFLEEYEFLKKIGFGEMHVFPYSPRPNTKSYKMDRIIPNNVKNIRKKELQALNEKMALNYRKNYLNEIMEVIVERNNNGIAYGHSRNYLQIEFKSDLVKENDLVKVKIIEVGYPISKGEIYEIY